MAERFQIDPSHSTVGFTAKHLVVTTVRGSFRDFAGSIELDPENPTSAKAEVTIQATSIDTGSADRDNHLRSADFFDAETHPELTFVSTEIRESGKNRYIAAGNLTIRGTSRPVELQIEVEDAIRDPWGNQRVGLSVRGKLNRKDWGLNWNQVLEAGALMVSEEIKLDIEAAFVRKLAEVAA